MVNLECELQLADYEFELVEANQGSGGKSAVVAT